MVQPTADAGNISVPMSSILDALEGVLTEAERTALFEQLIGLRPAGVAPGDLITAELFNQVLSDINDLSIRLAALEGASGGPILESLDPSTNVAVNQLFVVTGRNFNKEPNFNIVKIGNVDITQFREESSETHLIFPIPDLFSNLPQTLPVRVETGGRTSNVMQVTVQPQDKTQKGNFLFSPGQPTPTKPVATKTLSITWNVTAATMFDDTVALALLVSNPQGATTQAWLNTLAFQPTSPMSLGAGKTKQVTATLTVPAGATSAKLSLKVTSADGNVSNVSDEMPITVGSDIEVSSPKNDLSRSVIGAGLTEGKVTIDGNQLDGVLVKKMAGAGSVKITVTDARDAADGQQPINLAYKAEFVSPLTGLAINPDFSPKSASNVPFHDDRSFFVPLDAAGATVGTTAQLKVTVTQTNTVDNQKIFKSWLVIPLKIVA